MSPSPTNLSRKHDFPSHDEQIDQDSGSQLASRREQRDETTEIHPNILQAFQPSSMSSRTSNHHAAEAEAEDPDGHRYSIAAGQRPVISGFERTLPNTRRLYSIPKELRQASQASLPDHHAGDAGDQSINIPEVVETAKKVKFWHLFRFTSVQDRIVLVASILCAIAGGALIPLMPIVFSQFASSFLQVGANVKPVKADLVKNVLYFIYLAAAEFAVQWFGTWGLTRTGERIARRTRQQYLAALLRQDINYFSSTGAGECTARLVEDINTIQKGISEKLARTIHAWSTFITAFIIAFVLEWRLAAELLWCVVFGLFVMVTGIYFSFSNHDKILKADSMAVSLVEEAVSSIRNIKALNAENRITRKYTGLVEEAKKWGARQNIMMGTFFGFTVTANYLNIALVLWQGSRNISRGLSSFNDTFIIELVITQALYAFINSANHFETFSKALGAAQKVFETIDRKSEFDATSNKGTTINPLRGTVKFLNVTFSYPSRKKPVLDRIDLTFPAGKTTALVGASGSGKSSVIDLILRFHDPERGHVLVDSVNVADLNLRWLRQQIGVVNQNPTLFAKSIGENIRDGFIGSQYEDAPENEKEMRVIQAAVAANAHKFIMALPNKYDSQVGDRGFMLSGGQKQRIAIARALVGAPQILLLDEATSAIDSESEEKIVSVLDEKKASRTTIVVAHRLSTIKNADQIIVLEKGKVAEQGSHEELMRRKGAYYNLVQAGQSAEDTEKAVAAYANRKVSDSSHASSVSDRQKYNSMPSNSRQGNTLSPQLYQGHPGESSQNLTARDDRYTYNSVLSTRSGQPPSPQLYRGHPGESRQNLTARDPSAMEISQMSDIELDELRPDGRNQAREENIVEENIVKETLKQYSIWALIRFAWVFAEPERLWVYAGLVCCLFAGAEEAVNAILFGKSTVALSTNTGVTKFAWVYLGFALCQLIFFCGFGIALGKSSEDMKQRVKKSTFHNALRQDIAYYDATESSTTTLVSLLSTETKNMCGLSGATLGNLLVVGSTLLCSILIGVGFGWKLALVCTATVPCVLACGYFSVSFLGQHSARTSAEVQAAANKAAEALSDMRTIAILTKEADVMKQYCDALEELEKKSFWTIIRVSFLYALCQSIMFLCMALGFWYGGGLVGKEEYYAEQFFIVFTSVIWGARSAGHAFTFNDDISKAIQGCRLVKNLADRKVEIDAYDLRGIPLLDKPMGAIQFQDVSFSYPGHEDNPVLKKLNMYVMPDERIAIVGPSGCGKSSVVSLLERFYDPVSGTIFVDGEDISRYKLAKYREIMALVSQDVALYDGTILENITLGVPEPHGNSYDAQRFKDRLDQAIETANLRGFIDSLDNGLATVVGSKGCMLSGGQKQRISIARAVLRQPTILLLDEATAALDSHSEQEVQQALNKACRNRTTITIAHRLNTIRNADKIYFMEHGRFIESGSHDDLMALDGRYAEFVRLQKMMNHEE